MVAEGGPLTSSPAAYEAPLRASIAQEKLTGACTKAAATQRNSLGAQAALIHNFATEADKGQVKSEQLIALHILPLVRDIQQMVALVDESASKYDAAVLSNQRLLQLIAANSQAAAAPLPNA